MALDISCQNKTIEQPFCTLPLNWAFDLGNEINIRMLLAEPIELRNMHILQHAFIIIHDRHL